MQNGLNSKTTQNSEKASNGAACGAFTSELRITLFKGKNALFDAQNHAKPDAVRIFMKGDHSITSIEIG
ncbi:hypothetical protein, partial [Escherichia coli]|uniref:hypothetical protein n=1 Tax=Escherichia coli TaxID=562 RepID=UPI0030C65D5F